MSDDKKPKDVSAPNKLAQSSTSGKSALEGLLSAGLLLGGAVLAANVVDSLTSSTAKKNFIPGAVGNMNALGKAIRQRRQDLGMSQGQLAAASGVGNRFVIETEGGKGTAEIAKVIQLIDALGLQLSISTRT